MEEIGKKKNPPKEKRERSLSRIFAVYTMIFGIVVIGITILYFALFTACIFKGVFRPANYLDKKVKENEALISSEEIVKQYIPDECDYAVFTQSGDIAESNVSKKNAFKLKSQVEYGNRLGIGNIYYRKIERESGYCVVKYSMLMQFENPILRKYLSNTELLVFIVYILSLVVGMVVISRWFQRKMRKELLILKDATLQIKEKNLDFETHYTKVSDFNEILMSLDALKKELAASLTSRWKLEEERKSQFNALVHDIKTPLTIISGNAELLSESNLLKEDAKLNQNILEEVDQIQFYIQTLIEMNQSEKAVSIVKKEKINLNEFLQNIQNEVSALCNPKKITFLMNKINQEEMPDFFYIDEMSLKRALNNIISNAVFYCSEEKVIRFTTYCQSEQLFFVVEDSGKGFNKEELVKATQEFYQGDKSRSVKNHYGMGLYIANTLLKKQGGQLLLSNSEELGGAKVTCRIALY